MKLTRSCFYSVILITFFSLGCNSGEGHNSGKGKSALQTNIVENTARVQVKTVETHAYRSTMFQQIPGTVQPKLVATIEAQVSGRIEKINFQEGTEVKKGSVLAEISAKELKARLAQAIASLEQAKNDMKRFKRLLPAGAVTQQEFDNTQTHLQIANANVTEARTLVGYTKVTAPFTGVVTRKLVNQGDFAQPGKRLLVLEQSSQFRFECDLPESLASQLKLSQRFKVVLTGRDREFRGQVVEVSPTMDPGSRTRHIKLDIERDPVLRSGQYGYLRFPLKTGISINVPIGAVIKRGQLEFVYTVQDGRAMLRLIKTGKVLINKVEVISGLEEGDRVITSSVKKLTDGLLVEVDA